MHFELCVLPPDLPGFDRHRVERERRLALAGFGPRVRAARLEVAAAAPGRVDARLTLRLAGGTRVEARASDRDPGDAVRRAMSRAQRALRRRLGGEAAPRDAAIAGGAPAGHDPGAGA